MSDNQLTVSDLNLHLNNLRSVTNFFLYDRDICIYLLITQQDEEEEGEEEGSPVCLLHEERNQYLTHSESSKDPGHDWRTMGIHLYISDRKTEVTGITARQKSLLSKAKILQSTPAKKAMEKSLMSSEKKVITN